MSDDDLERAVAAALEAGLTLPEDIAAFAQERHSPFVQLEVETIEERVQGSMISARLTIAKPSGSIH